MNIFDKQRVLNFLRRPLEIVVLRYIFGSLVLVPTVMLLLWLVTPTKTINVLLINKSVPDEMRTEHAAFSWMLKQERITDSEGEFYSKESDYYGFHPRLGGDFLARDFEAFDSLMIDSLAEQTDLLYFADAYGVYSHDYGGDLDARNRLLYGGVNRSDFDLLRAVQKKSGTIIAEFSIFGPPTVPAIRDSLQNLFGLNWSGWVGRYFISLDTTANDALPPWVVELYQQQHGPVWPFFDSGIVLVKGGDILVLEYGTHLTEETPLIETQEVYRGEYGLPAVVRYPFWFDIVTSPQAENRVVSIFHIPVNILGDSLLVDKRIPSMFPAVLYHADPMRPFYYFSGDFSDNPVSDFSAHFKGIEIFQSFLYNKEQMADRRQFFWRFYRPLMQHILDTLDTHQ